MGSVAWLFRYRFLIEHPCAMLWCPRVKGGIDYGEVSDSSKLRR